MLQKVRILFRCSLKLIMEAKSISECCESGKRSVSVSQLDGNISPVVEKCLTHIIDKENFVYYNLGVRDITTKGGNYMGILQEIDLKGKSKNGEKEISLFLKNRPIGEGFNMLPLEEAYNREAFYYNELAKIYDKLQEDANVPNEDRLKIPKSYQESNSDVTILDNLSKKGFITSNRLDGMSLGFAEKSIKQLAQFHGMSFVLKAKMPEYFEERIKPLKSPMNPNDEFKDFLKNIFDPALICLEGESRRKMENIFPVMYEKYEQFVNRDHDNAICLCHGDFRPNNIMFLEKVSKYIISIMKSKFYFWLHLPFYTLFIVLLCLFFSAL
jgi:hypothetical protein